MLSCQTTGKGKTAALPGNRISFSFALLFCLDVVAWPLAKMDVVLVVITFYFISTGKLRFSRENNGNTRKVIAWCTLRSVTRGSRGFGPHQFCP